MKNNALYKVVEEGEVRRNRHILKDELIELRGLETIEKCRYSLRRIEAYDPETDKVLVSLTNQLELGSTTISASYEDRWQTEIFLNALKQYIFV